MTIQEAFSRLRDMAQGPGWLPTRSSVVCVAALLLMTGCTPEKGLVVSAAASLTNAFTELARAYERDHPGTSVVVNFGGSGQLLRQIERGAPADVFASADEETMDLAQRKGLIDAASRRDFARNKLVIIVPASSVLELETLSDLGGDEITRIAISNPESVPVGRYSRRALEHAGLWEALHTKVINTQHVRQSLDYVARGEVDVGFVYLTDARAMPEKVRVVMEVPLASPIAYPIAVVADSRSSATANRFIEFVSSPNGERILLQHGFDPG